MSNRAFFLAPLAAALAALCSSCGYVSDPLPPSLNIPMVVTDLTAQQRGDKLVVDCTIPLLTTDGVVMTRVGAVDLRGGPYAGPGWDLNRWAEQARKIEPHVEKPGPVHLEIPIDDWAGQVVVLALRVAGPKGKLSDWSNVISIPVVQPLGPPAGLRAEAVREGVKVEWQVPEGRPGLSFRVYKRAPDQKEAVLAAPVEKPPYIDRDTQYGRQYAYSVQTIQKVAQVEAESDISSPVSVTPQDTFAPVVPSGLAGIAGTNSIQLSWDPNAEPDLKGYRVYRAAEGEQLQRLAEVDTPSYSDRAVQPGKKFRYAVSAVDQLGNESARSAPVEVAVQ